MFLSRAQQIAMVVAAGAAGVGLTLLLTRMIGDGGGPGTSGPERAASADTAHIDGSAVVVGSFGGVDPDYIPADCSALGEELQVTVADGSGDKLLLLPLVNPEALASTDSSSLSCDFDFLGDVDSDATVFEITFHTKQDGFPAPMTSKTETVSRADLTTVTFASIMGIGSEAFD